MRSLLIIGLFILPRIIFAQIPNSPVIQYVSITGPNQQVTICWTDNNDTSQIRYFRINDFRKRLSVWGHDSIQFADKKKSIYVFDYDTVRYRPVFFTMNTMGLTAPSLALEPGHRTIFTTTKYDTCTNRIIINWTPYIGWGNKLTNYKVFEASTMTPVSTSLSPTDTTFSIENAIQNQMYSLLVVASSNNGFSSFSNIDSIFTKTMQVPTFVTAENASFVSQNQVTLHFQLDTAAEVCNYQLLRSNNPSGIWEKLGDYLNFRNDTLVYTDNITSNKSIYYRLDALSNCNIKIRESNIATAIVPTYSINNLQLALSWDSYLDWPQGLQGYHIYRSVSNSAFTEIGTSGTLNSYSDDLTSLAGQQLTGNICYYVESVPSSGNYTSHSKTVCIDLSSMVYIPNGFTPNGDGMNDEFKAFFAFLPEDFTMILFDRYGFKVFETKNPTQGWKGVLNNGHKAPEAAYIYFITFKTQSGEKVEKRGNFTLINK